MRLSAFATTCILILCNVQVGCQPPAKIPSSSEADRQVDAGASSSLSSAAIQGEPEVLATVEVAIADLVKLAETVKNQVGRVVVVDIWSLSCAPCMREFPHLVELSKRYPDSVACVSLNVDYIGLKSKPPESYLPAASEFLQKQHATLITNLLSAATDEAVLTQFKLESIPAILIYGSDGELLHTLTDVNTGEDGLTYAGDVIPKIDELLVSQK